jgi:uncharacterized protein (TIGR03437 family)
MTIRPSALLVPLLGVWAAAPGSAQTVTFDFDTGTPAVASGQNLPFDQTSAGVTARFTSRPESAFSVQRGSAGSANLTLSKFTGNYLYDNRTSRDVLVMQFNRTITGITLTFATADYEIEVPSTIELTAYLDSNATPPVGRASARGAYGSDTLPMGTLTFNSGERPFNLVEVTLPYEQLRGATDFLVDNIVVVLGGAGGFASASAASYASGALAAGSIATGYGQGLASGTGEATSQPPPTTLAGTNVKVKDSTGVERQAPLFFVSPSQINYLVPVGTAAGAATVTVTSAGQITATGVTSIEPVAPGLFTANFDGRGVPAAVAVSVAPAPDYTQTTQAVASCGNTAGSCVPSPIDLGPSGTQVVLLLFGTGIRGCSSQAGVGVKIGGIDAQVQYAGAQFQFAGLDQVNVLVPPELAGRREVDLVMTVDGKAANTVRVHIR